MRSTTRPPAIEGADSPNRSRTASRASWLAAGILAILVAAGSLRLAPQGLYFDAAAYALAADQIRNEGPFEPWYGSDLRTYGYPLFLALATGLGRNLGLDTRDAAFLLQWPLLIGASAFLASSITLSLRRRQLIFLAIAANPLVIIHTAEVLTEALSIALVLVAAGALCRLQPEDAASATRPMAWLAIAGLASGTAFIVRPASVVVPIAYLIAVTLWLTLQRAPQIRSVRSRAAVGVVALSAVLLPLVPQIVINVRFFDMWSPFTRSSVSDIQASAGVQMLRYATNVSGCGAPSMPFPSPWQPAIESGFSTSDALEFYLTDLPDGPLTALAHVFSALDPRPFTTFAARIDPMYERVLQVFTVAILVAAAPAALQALRRFPHIVKQPGHAMLVFLLLGGVGIAGYSAAEYRFGLLVVTCLSLLASSTVWSFRRVSRRVRGALVLALVLATPMWMVASDAVLRQSPIWQQCS